MRGRRGARVTRGDVEVELARMPPTALRHAAGDFCPHLSSDNDGGGDDEGTHANFGLGAVPSGFPRDSVVVTRESEPLPAVLLKAVRAGEDIADPVVAAPTAHSSAVGDGKGATAGGAAHEGTTMQAFIPNRMLQGCVPAALLGPAYRWWEGACHAAHGVSLVGEHFMYVVIGVSCRWFLLTRDTLLCACAAGTRWM